MPSFPGLASIVMSWGTFASPLTMVTRHPGGFECVILRCLRQGTPHLNRGVRSAIEEKGALGLAFLIGMTYFFTRTPMSAAQ